MRELRGRFAKTSDPLTKPQILIMQQLYHLASVYFHLIKSAVKGLDILLPDG